MLAAVTNLAGALAGTAVATTVGQGLVDAHCVTGVTLICGLLGAILWNLLTWRLGLPSSSSHALIGGLVGSAVASAGNNWSVVIWSAPVEGKPWYAWGGLLYKVIIPMFSSPILGFVIGFLWMTLLYMLLWRCRPSSINRVFGKLQIFSAGFLGFSHGSNDAQKTMGIVALALFSATNARGPRPPARLAPVPAHPRIQGPALGKAHLRGYDGRGHRHRRPANHQDAGPQSLPAPAGQRLCGRHHFRHGAHDDRAAGHARLHHSCRFDLDHGRRRGAEPQGYVAGIWWRASSGPGS